jgi:acid phosphatase
MRAVVPIALLAAGLSIFSRGTADAQKSGIDNIETVVVIYAENRGFDNLYAFFPGANGLQNIKPAEFLQRDRDGSVLSELPPIWDGLTPKSVTPAVPQDKTAHLPNKPFAIDNPSGLNTPLTIVTRDLWHQFYQNQMQINGGKNDKFAAFSDAGGLVMGYYDGSKLPMWDLAKTYVLADNFFQGAFGGSFLNHFQLVCACTPVYPNADQGPAKKIIAAVELDRVSVTLAPDSPKSALEGAPKLLVKPGLISPDFYAVNTMQPPYQPSENPPVRDGDPLYADPNAPNTLPPQRDVTVGDLLSLKGVTWAWYAGAWQDALSGGRGRPVPNFQFHHQPFNFFVQYAPGTAARAEHLKDGGVGGVEFIKDIDSGKLPQVSFYKPQGNLNEHPGYTDAMSGDQHIADVIAHLQKSPQWAHMLVVVTYDENGGFWDHAAPPKADRWGPGSRIPTIIVSPYANMGMVDHTLYDTTSILRFITRRFNLAILAGLAERDAALKAHNQPPLGDLTAALKF